MPRWGSTCGACATRISAATTSTYDMDGIDPIVIPAMPNLRNMLNVAFFVETDAGQESLLLHRLRDLVGRLELRLRESHTAILSLGRRLAIRLRDRALRSRLGLGSHLLSSSLTGAGRNQRRPGRGPDLTRWPALGRRGHDPRAARPGGRVDLLPGSPLRHLPAAPSGASNRSRVPGW